MRLKIFVLLSLSILITSFSLSIFAINNNLVIYANSGLVKYNGKVEHLFTHCLIAYPELAFNDNNFMHYDYDRDCLTTKEFIKILNSLYQKNYILVRMSDVYEIKKDKAVKKSLYIPKGKKPLILSFDDVNYDSKKLGRGMVDKIILDENNNLATYTKDAPDNQTISYNKEFINVLSDFIDKYPNFSHDGAKGLICLTGYDGILGYRTDLIGINRMLEIEAVKPIIRALKNEGWEFASHSYGHYHMSKITDAKFESEVNRWKSEVESLVGPTEIYIYPYGEYEISNKKAEKVYKHKLLEKAGFKVFCGVGKKYFFGYAPFNMDNKDRVLFMDRRPLDGNNLRKNHKEYRQFFDSYDVYDHDARTVKFNQKSS